MGNETGWGANFDAMYKAMKAIDPTRPIHYESKNPAYANVLSRYDIISTMYPSVEEILRLMHLDPTRPVIICEYAHTMGNSLGNFKKYWDAYYKYPRLQGGFTWDWVDQGLRSKDENGKEYWNIVNYIDGANANDGLINPDRVPQPEINEAKKIQQEIAVSEANLEKGQLKVHNRFFFSDLSHIYMHWEISQNGIVKHSGEINELNINPQDSAIVNIPGYSSNIAKDGTHLNVSFKLKKATLWAPRGFEIAKEQFSYKMVTKYLQSISNDKLKLVQNEKSVTVASPNFKAEINKTTGSLSQISFLRTSMLSNPVVPCFWRVPTDNDEGGGENSYAARWRKAGLNNYTVKVNGMTIDSSNQIIKVVINSVMEFKEGSMNLITHYNFYNNGSIQINYHVNLLNDFPPLARVGVEFAMPSNFDKIEWFGRGPFESYQDRKESAHFGLYSGKVADQHFPHVMPQENGNKTDVVWMDILGLSRGLKIEAHTLLNVNVQNYSQRALNNSKTTHELVRGDHTYVHLDLQQMGLGGDDSWTPRVHPEYLLTAPSYEFGFTLKPY
jgi:beta-galactosidase